MITTKDNNDVIWSNKELYDKINKEQINTFVNDYENLLKEQKANELFNTILKDITINLNNYVGCSGNSTFKNNLKYLYIKDELTNKYKRFEALYDASKDLYVLRDPKPGSELKSVFDTNVIIGKFLTIDLNLKKEDDDKINRGEDFYDTSDEMMKNEDTIIQRRIKIFC